MEHVNYLGSAAPRPINEKRIGGMTMGILITGLERLPTPTSFGVTENLFT